MNKARLSKLLYPLVSLVLAACQAQATSVPTVPPLPATPVPPTAVPTTAPDQALTTFSPKTFDLPITVRYGSEWSIAEEYSDEFLLSYAGHDAGVAFIQVKNVKIGDGLTFPDDFVAWLQSPSSLFHIVDSKAVLVGGFPGTQINAIAACGSQANWLSLSGTGWRCPGDEPIGFVYLENVQGERVLIQIQGSPDGNDYKFIVDESQKVLNTVAFSKP